MPESDWPPKFTVATESILELFTGESFYSNVDASMREAVLNAIDGIGRRRDAKPEISPHIEVVFDVQSMTVTVSDNGEGMGTDELTGLFSKIGASAAALARDSAQKRYSAVGEFGIGILSYFLVCDGFEVHTVKEGAQPIGLEFPRTMLNAVDSARIIDPKRSDVGTTLILSIKEKDHFERLKERFPHWIRDVQGLTARIEPGGDELKQGGLSREIIRVDLQTPDWVHEAHIGPPVLFSSWDTFDGAAHVDVLYRGVFVSQVSIDGFWAIEGAIHVDPKHFRPKLDREGFVGEDLQTELEPVLRAAHPKVLERAIDIVKDVLSRDKTKGWSLLKWVTLWLAIPRSGPYSDAARAWDAEFRRRRAFRLLVARDQQREVSIEDLQNLEEDAIYVAPDQLNQASPTVQQAVRVLRTRNLPVVQGIQRDAGFLSRASLVGQSTASLLANYFRDTLPPLIAVETIADEVIVEEAVITVFDTAPHVQIVHLGEKAGPIIPAQDDLWINIDSDAGKLMLEAVCNRNEGHVGLWVACLAHAPEHARQVATVLGKRPLAPNTLGPVRRQYLRSLVR